MGHTQTDSVALSVDQHTHWQTKPPRKEEEDTKGYGSSSSSSSLSPPINDWIAKRVKAAAEQCKSKVACKCKHAGGRQTQRERESETVASSRKAAKKLANWNSARQSQHTQHTLFRARRQTVKWLPSVSPCVLAISRKKSTLLLL